MNESPGGAAAVDLLLAGDRRLADPATTKAEIKAIREASIALAPVLTNTIPGWREQDIEVPLPNGWHALNPSVVAAGEGFVLSARCVNYTSPGGIIAPGYTGIVSRTAVVPLDADGRQAGPAQFLEDLTTPDHELDDKNRGPEDIRLLLWQDRLMGVGTCARRLGTNRTTVLCYGLFDLDLEAGAICSPRWLAEGQSGSVEKNWMPAVSSGGVHLVYSCGPTVVLSLDPASGQMAIAATQRAPLTAWRFRGGSQLIPYDDGWLAIVHEGIDHDEGYRTYLQRIVRFGPDFSITHYSLPFRMHGEPVEYVSGLAWCGDRLLITYAIGERVAIAASAPAADVLALLRPLDDIAPAGAQPGEVPQAHSLLSTAGDPVSLFNQATAMLERGWHAAAVTTFRHCARTLPDDLLAARAAFRAAMILGNELGTWDEAVSACLEGLARMPDLVDLYWAAGYASYWGGKYGHAARWARIAMAINAEADAGTVSAPGGIEYPSARGPAPADILAHAQRKLAEGSQAVETHVQRST